jgi:hypothetical protein
MLPLWRDPKYATEEHVRQFEAHEAEIRRRERERERRRMQPLMATTGTTWCTQEEDWRGCTL